MKEWILENTTVTKEEYEKLLNFYTVSTKGNGKQYLISELSNHPIVNIALFTTKKPTFFHRKKYKVKRKKDSNKHYYYIYKQIQFYILSDFLKDYINDLYTTKRHHQCFHLNSKICLTLNTQNYLITALCKSPYIKTNPYYIHTFILIITENNQEYIIDATANIIMKKEIYFNIFKPKIISCIEKEKLQLDFEYITPLEKSGCIYKAEYYCFPEKVINGIKKHVKNRNL